MVLARALGEPMSKCATDRQRIDRIVTVIGSTRKMLDKLEDGLGTEDHSPGLAKLAMEIAIAATILEALVTASGKT